MHIDGADQLGFEAVGLWHKLHHAYGSRCSRVDLLNVHRGLQAWDSVDELRDPRGPMGEVVAVGYVEEDAEGLLLYEEVES